MKLIAHIAFGICCFCINVSLGLFEEYQFFGLDVNNNDNQIKHITQYGLTCLLREYNNTNGNTSEIKEVLNSMCTHDHLVKAWRHPSSFHVTTIYNPSLYPGHPAINAFNEGKEVLIKVKGMVYLPNKLLSLFVNVDTPIQNKIPHLTVLLNEYQAKHSNDVLEIIFGFDKYLRKYYYYHSLFIIKILDDIIIKAVDIDVFNTKETILIIFFKAEYTLHSKFKPYKKEK